MSRASPPSSAAVCRSRCASILWRLPEAARCEWVEAGAVRFRRGGPRRLCWRQVRCTPDCCTCPASMCSRARKSSTPRCCSSNGRHGDLDRHRVSRDSWAGRSRPRSRRRARHPLLCGGQGRSISHALAARYARAAQPPWSPSRFFAERARHSRAGPFSRRPRRRLCDVGTDAVKVSRGTRFVDDRRRHAPSSRGVGKSGSGRQARLSDRRGIATRHDSDRSRLPRRRPALHAARYAWAATPRCRPLREGDLIAVLQSGAYGLTASPTGFLSHPPPAEVLIENGRHRLIRRRGTLEEQAALPT